MASSQIRIERKTLAVKRPAQTPIDLRTPTGKKLPY